MILPVSKLYIGTEDRMIDELESIWKEAMMTETRYHSGIYGKGQENRKKPLVG
jgi:hypothetical protein